MMRLARLGSSKCLKELLNVRNDSTAGGGSNPSFLDELAGKLVTTLNDVARLFPLEALVRSITAVTELIRHQQHPHNSTFELLSRLLVIAGNADTVSLPDSLEKITGAEFKEFVVDRICTAPWNTKSVVPLSTVLGDIDIESKQLEMAIVKLIKQFKDVDASDLPTLIYNILLLSSKGHQRLVLRGIFEFFDRLESGKELAACFVVKQDQDLGTELLKHMKSGKLAFLSTFSLMCLLTMARVGRYEDNVMDYLKSSILSMFKDEEKIQQESWVTEYEGIASPPILDMFRAITKKIPHGMDQINQSIVQCGVYIMDSMAPTTPWRASDEAQPKKTKLKPTDHACELGAAILAEMFKAQVSVRAEILNHIMARVVAKSVSTMYFLNLLETIVKESSDALLEHLPKIKESLDYLSMLSLPTAVRLMAAVKNVAKMNRPFRDSLMLILRKALFSKSLESRQVALSGSLLLLESSNSSHLNIQGSSSRSGGDHQQEHEVPDYAIEVLESSPSLTPIIFEIFQAHFVQFYDRTGSRLAPLALDECIENATTGGEPSLIEPLQYLMSAAIQVDSDLMEECHNDLYTLVLGLNNAGLEDFELDKTSDFHMASNIGVRNNMYASLLIGCYESSIEYMVLRQQAIDSSSNGKGAVNAHRHQYSDHGVMLSTETVDIVLHLFTKMRKLHDIVREKAVLPKGKSMGPLGEATVLGMECITQLMERIFPENSQDHEAQKLKANDDFVYYITTVAHMSLLKIQSHSNTLTDTEYDYCRRISVVIVREFLASRQPDSPRALAAGAKVKDKNKSLLMVGIETLTMGLMIVQRFHSLGGLSIIHQQDSALAASVLQNLKVACGFLAATLPQANGGLQPGQQSSDVVAWTTTKTLRHDVDSLAAAYCQFLQDLFQVFVNETIPLVKEAAGVLNMIQILSKYLNRPATMSISVVPGLVRKDSAASMDSAPETSQLDQLVHWLVRVCRDQPIDDSSLAKACLSMMLSLEQESSSPEENAALVAMDDRGQPGSSRQPAAPHPSFVNGASVSTVLLKFPAAATRLRLAADILVTYNLNHGPSIQSVPENIDPNVELDEQESIVARLRQEIGIETKFSVVTMRTVASVTDILLTHVDGALDHLEWAVGKLRYCGLSQITGSINLESQEPALSKASSSSSSSSFSSTSRAPAASQASIPADSLPQLDLKSVRQLEAEICSRVEVCMWVLSRITQSCLPNVAAEHLIKVLSHCYRVLAKLTKYYLTPGKLPISNLFDSSAALSLLSKEKDGVKQHTAGTGIQIPHGFLRVTEVAGQRLSKHIYEFLAYFQAMDADAQEQASARQAGSKKAGKKGGGKGKVKGNGGDLDGNGNANDDDEGHIIVAAAAGGVVLGGMNVGKNVKSRQKAKILRESRSIPTLIYTVEQYERYVIQLSKKSKVKVTQYFRRSTARDFKIQIQRLEDLGLEEVYEQERQMLQLQQLHDEDAGDVTMAGDMEGKGESM
ncbi:hypothetical protein BG004_001377, partial [Podila humilis]